MESWNQKMTFNIWSQPLSDWLSVRPSYLSSCLPNHIHTVHTGHFTWNHIPTVHTGHFTWNQGWRPPVMSIITLTKSHTHCPYRTCHMKSRMTSARHVDHHVNQITCTLSIPDTSHEIIHTVHTGHFTWNHIHTVHTGHFTWNHIPTVHTRNFTWNQGFFKDFPATK